MTTKNTVRYLRHTYTTINVEAHPCNDVKPNELDIKLRRVFRLMGNQSKLTTENKIFLYNML